VGNDALKGNQGTLREDVEGFAAEQKANGDEMIGIISLVAEQGFGLDKRQQRAGLRDVMDLPHRSG
jgi:hypothetical protein